MKALLMAIGLLASTSLTADEGDLYRTAALVNCRGLMVKFSPEGRSLYVAGLEDGYMAALTAYAVTAKLADEQVMSSAWAHFGRAPLTIGEKVAALNVFCAVPENASIQVGHALDVIAARQSK